MTLCCIKGYSHAPLVLSSGIVKSSKVSPLSSNLTPLNVSEMGESTGVNPFANAVKTLPAFVVFF